MYKDDSKPALLIPDCFVHMYIMLVQIFVESLLCSGKVESIQLSLSYMEAVDAMEASTQSMSSSVGSLIDSQIPYQQAIGKCDC